SWVHPGVQPDLTLWFDLSAELASQRRAAARTADRFEQLDTAFFERVGSAYAQRARNDPQRMARIDASLSFEAVALQVFKVLEARGW
ncbi:MAG: dTMP kinase, partial [Pseudorhodobacter sp.]|nr:dTMP kinase [Rhizobacter sp.]